MTYKSFVTKGQGLGLAKKLRKIYELAGYKAMPVDEYTSAIRAGRHPAGTLAFAVVKEKPFNLVGTVVIDGHGQVLFEGDEKELQGVLK